VTTVIFFFPTTDRHTTHIPHPTSTQHPPQYFDALVLTTVTTTRKFFTILVSVSNGQGAFKMGW
jgi:hypothetical protein